MIFSSCVLPSSTSRVVVCEHIAMKQIQDCILIHLFGDYYNNW